VTTLSKELDESRYTETEMSLVNASFTVDAWPDYFSIDMKEKVQLKRRNYLHADVQRSMIRSNKNE
jgi:hypothetical protein